MSEKRGCGTGGTKSTDSTERPGENERGTSGKGTTGVREESGREERGRK